MNFSQRNVEMLCRDFGTSLPGFQNELLRAVELSALFADRYERETLTLAQVATLGLWAAGVTPAIEAATAALLRNNDRLAASL